MITQVRWCTAVCWKFVPDSTILGKERKSLRTILSVEVPGKVIALTGFFSTSVFSVKTFFWIRLGEDNYGHPTTSP